MSVSGFTEDARVSGFHGFLRYLAKGSQPRELRAQDRGSLNSTGCKLKPEAPKPLNPEALPRGPIVVPFWDYLIGFYI